MGEEKEFVREREKWVNGEICYRQTQRDDTSASREHTAKNYKAVCVPVCLSMQTGLLYFIVYGFWFLVFCFLEKQSLKFSNWGPTAKTQRLRSIFIAGDTVEGI